MRALTVWAVAAMGCAAQLGAPDDDPAGAMGAGLVGLRLTPDQDVLLTDLGQPAAARFTVLGVRGDGATLDLTARAALSLDTPAAGQLDGATLRAAPRDETAVAIARVRANVPGVSPPLSAVAEVTLVWLRRSGDRPDFFFRLPYDPAGPPQVQTLSLTTRIQSLDAFFAVDTTASMGQEIAQLRDSLEDAIIPGVQAAVKDAWFGVGAVEDFPLGPFGRAGARPGAPDDEPFLLLSAMTSDVPTARLAVGDLLWAGKPRGDGDDLPEGQLEALYQIATGAGNVVPGVVDVPPFHKAGTVGGVGFRAGALPVITLVTDAVFHTRGEPAKTCPLHLQGGGTFPLATEYAGATLLAAHGRAEVAAALAGICAHVIGISALRTDVDGLLSDPAGVCSATDDLQQMARDTGARVPPEAWDGPSRPAGCATGACCTGLGGAGEAPDAEGLCPLVFKVPQSGSGLSQQVISGITQLARYARFDVLTSTGEPADGQVDAQGGALPAGRTPADFIQALGPLDATPPAGGPPLAPPAPLSDDGDGAGRGGFLSVLPGTQVRFRIAARNDFQPQAAATQVFRATIRLRAGGCADLDQRDVIFLIPPAPPVPG